uniref:Homeobox domain-containing protein n=1 Tax=Heterorhabditis bacteriophora TaxID=37862 RepID=A0A1I7WZI5_HETBA
MKIKIKEIALDLRKQRAYSIHNELQYLFIYSTVLDYIRVKRKMGRFEEIYTTNTDCSWYKTKASLYRIFVCSTPPSVSSINRILRTRAAERAAEELTMILNAQHMARQHRIPSRNIVPSLGIPSTAFPFPFQPAIWPGLLLNSSSSFPPLQLNPFLSTLSGLTVDHPSPTETVAMSEEDPAQGRRCSRSSFSQEQLEILESAFLSEPYPNSTDRLELMKRTQLPEARIQVSQSFYFIYFLSFKQCIFRPEDSDLLGESSLSPIPKKSNIFKPYE